jgi:hypothetical protein
MSIRDEYPLPHIVNLCLALRNQSDKKKSKVMDAQLRVFKIVV